MIVGAADSEQFSGSAGGVLQTRFSRNSVLKSQFSTDVGFLKKALFYSKMTSPFRTTTTKVSINNSKTRNTKRYDTKIPTFFSILICENNI